MNNGQVKHLYLLRHAQASWQLAGELDYQRGLTEHGVADCALVAEHVRSRDIAPMLVLCSGARRTKETLEHVAPALPPEAVIEYDDAIYGADTSAIFGVVSAAPADVDAILLIGHNPSMHDFAVELAAGDGPIEELAGSFPKAALAELELDCEWAELAPDCARLTEFFRPKEARTAS